MSHDWHNDTIEGCLHHAQTFAQSCVNVLGGDRLHSDMQAALAADMRDVLEDIQRLGVLVRLDGLLDIRETTPYIQHLEGVVFAQLHKIQQLEKEVARHAAQA